MASPIAIYDEKETFYVPHFQIAIAGRTLPHDLRLDMMQATYRDSIDDIDSFELTVNNWDADEGKFKYEPHSKPEFEKLFDPGQQLELKMGYLGSTRLMLRGEITTLEPNYPGSGPPTLTVRGLNVLHSFRSAQHTWTWHKKRDSDIAKEIGGKPVSKDQPGLGMEVRVDADASRRETEERFVFMNNRYDILFLLERARLHGYSVFLDEDSQTRRPFLYFGPSNRLRDVTYKLEWGKSLVQFRPTLTTTNQISTVTVRGWDRKTKKPIEGSAKLGDKDVPINVDQHAVALAIQARHEVVADSTVYSKESAEKLAKQILRNQLQEMVKATGVTVGLPDLRAGRKLQILKLGPRFSGEYFVTESKHTIGEDGYRTEFTARREKGL